MSETNKTSCQPLDQRSPCAHYAQYPRAAKRPAPGLPMYRVIPAGKAFYHVVETATDRVIGYRRHHADACALAQHLETRDTNEQTRIRANSGALRSSNSATATHSTISGIACRGVDMELQNNDLGTLFQQLNLDSDPASIDAFIAEHQLGDNVKLIDAEFWSPAQAAFLKEQLREDADWAMTVDELNVRLHETPANP